MKAIISALKSPEGWIGALAIASVLTLPTGLMDKLRKIPHSTEQTEAKAIDAHARFEAAADKICGNGGWFPVTETTIQCATHRGRKTFVAEVRP